MGVDLVGYLEANFGANESPAWTGIIPLDFLPRHHDMSGCLFGVMNYAQFRPVAARRGLPPDLSSESERLVRECEGAVHDATFLDYNDYRAIRWNEQALGADRRVHRYKRGSNGRLEFVKKSLPARPSAAYDLAEGEELEFEGEVFKRVRLRRREVLDVSPEWQLLFEILTTVAESRPASGARLVCWFDGETSDALDS